MVVYVASAGAGFLDLKLDEAMVAFFCSVLFYYSSLVDKDFASFSAFVTAVSAATAFFLASIRSASSLAFSAALASLSFLSSSA